MKQEANDKLVREKLGTLDTLTGGIVYAREEAWEKLQARMEQKPAKKIMLKYWLAAAAVLLLFVGVTAIYNRPSVEVVKTVSKIAAPATDLPPAQQSNIVTQKEQPAASVMDVVADKVPQTVINNAHAHLALPINVVPAPEPASLTGNEKPVATTVPAPVSTVAPPMKVYFINDVEHNDASRPAPAYAVSSKQEDLSKLPTLHILQVEKEEVEVKTILRENRMSIGRRIFLRPTELQRLDNVGSSQEEYAPSRNPIKSILNIQN